MAGPEVGDLAPDALLTDLERREVRLSSLWKERPAVVVFLRYFGCPFCQTQVVTLRNEHERIRRSGADVGLVGHGDPEAAIEFASSKGLPFPLLLDRDRGTYRAYGLVQGKAMQVLSPRVALPGSGQSFPQRRASGVSRAATSCRCPAPSSWTPVAWCELVAARSGWRTGIGTSRIRRRSTGSSRLWGEPNDRPRTSPGRPWPPPTSSRGSRPGAAPSRAERHRSQAPGRGTRASGPR